MLNLKLFAKYFLVFIFGFALGWGFKPQTVKHSHDVTWEILPFTFKKVSMCSPSDSEQVGALRPPYSHFREYRLMDKSHLCKCACRRDNFKLAGSL